MYRFYCLILGGIVKELPNAKQYLRRNFSFDKMDKIAYSKSDTEFINKMNSMKKIAFKKLKL